jgi:beta-glucosidase
LCGFRRIHLEPGETRKIHFKIQVKDWAIWDVTRDRYCVESGEYTLLAGASSADIRVELSLTVQGEVIPPRQAGESIRAENLDDCAGIVLDESKEQKEACVRPHQRHGWIAFQGVDLDAAGVTELRCRVSGNSSDAAQELRLDTPDGEPVACVDVGHTGGSQAWTTVVGALVEASGTRDLYLVLSGEVRLSHFTLSVSATGIPGLQA